MPKKSSTRAAAASKKAPAGSAGARSEPPAKMRARQPFDFDRIAAAFAEGFENTSMERIAERAGVAKRTLYYHFESKEALYDLTVSVICDDAVEHLFAAYDRADELPPPLNMKGQLDAFFAYSLEHPERRALLFDIKASTSASLAKIEATTRKLTERIAESFRKSARTKGRPTQRSPLVLAAMTVGAADHVMRLLTRSNDWDVEAVSLLMTELWAHAFANVSTEALTRADRLLSTEP